MSHKHRVYFAFSTFFQCFSQYSRSYSVCVSFFSLFGFLASRFFSFFTFLNASRHISSPIGCVFQFSKFFSFFVIFQGLQCSFLNIHNFQCFSPYSRSNSVFVSFYSFFSFLAIILILQCVFLIFHVFQCFLLYSMSNSVCISFFSLFFSNKWFFSHFPRFYHFFCHNSCSRVCVFPPFQFFPRLTVCVFHFPKLSISRHIPGPTVRIFLAIIQVLHCVFLFFHVFQCYLPYFTSYSVHFSFSTLFSVPRHFPGQTMFVSHFSRFYFFSQYSMSYSVHFSFSTFFSVS